jgi:hypothetical protein
VVAKVIKVTIGWAIISKITSMFLVDTGDVTVEFRVSPA